VAVLERCSSTLLLLLLLLCDCVFLLQFLECLFVHYDFDGAQQKLLECEAVIDNDYFLTAIKAEFLESARLFIFETYCRIHQVGKSDLCCCCSRG